MHGVEEMRRTLRDAAKTSDGAPFVIANHNSKLDSIALSAFIPTDVSHNLRSLIKAALLDEPMFGEYAQALFYISRCGVKFLCSLVWIVAL